MPDSLTLTFKNEESRLELQFTPSEGGALTTVVCVRQGKLNLAFASYSFGYDLAEFACELESLHARYEGIARLINQAGDIEIEFSLVHPARGIVGVLAKLEHCVSWPADYAPVHQQLEGRALLFQGFTTEQSYLPSLVTQIREFLAATRVSTIHPMLHETSA